MSKHNVHFRKSDSFDTIEPGVPRSYLLLEFRICATDVSCEQIKKYLEEIAQTVGLSAYESREPVSIVTLKSDEDTQHTIDAVWLGTNGNLHLYYWPKQRLVTLDVHAAGRFNLSRASGLDSSSLEQITKDHFGLIESTQLSLQAQNMKQENSKVEVCDDVELGRGVFAKEDIAKGEFIGGLYGKFHEAKDCMSLPEQYRDHVMQCANNFWRGNKSSAEAVQYLNHSCEPNCGVFGLFDFVAMKDIKAGEQITTDYAMQDDSNWVVPGGACLCGAEKCRGDILPYRDLSEKEKEEYEGYVSHWILHKYKICSCPRK